MKCKSLTQNNVDKIDYKESSRPVQGGVGNSIFEKLEKASKNSTIVKMASELFGYFSAKCRTLIEKKCKNR